MSKLFNFAQAKGKWHKFPSFNLGGGAKLYKNFAQKLLAVSLCMAMVLLGVPRGQNFVAEAADEATKSVALLTLTLTGNEEEPLTAKMDWKSFVQGTTVGLEVIFVDEEGNASEPLDYGSWIDKYGSMDHYDAGFKAFAPAAWLEALPAGTDAGALFGVGWSPDLLPYARALLATRDWSSPPSAVLDSYGAPAFPGLACVALGSSLSVAPHPYLAPFTEVTSVTYVAEVKDSSVVSFDSDSSSIVGVGVGTTTVSLSCSCSVGDQQYSLMPLGALDVEVYNPAVSVTGVSLSEPTKSLAVGESFDLTATITPSDATNKAVKWTSSEPNVASVDENGTVKALKAGKTTITVTTEDGDHTATCEVTVTEAGGTPPPDPTPGTNPDAPPADTPDTSAYLEATVDVKGQQQRLRVYDPDAVLPSDTSFSAAYVDGSHGDHNFFVQHVDPATGVELRHFYNLTLTSGGKTLSQLDGPVELWFEAIDGIDAPDSFISRVTENADAKLSPTIYTDNDGVTWIKVLTDHFSPYALTDLLSDAEKAALAQENSGPKNNAKTGDLAVQIAVAGLGMTLVLALGIMLRLITNRKTFEK